MHDDVPDSSNNIMLTTNQPSESRLVARPEPHHIMHVPSHKKIQLLHDVQTRTEAFKKTSTAPPNVGNLGVNRPRDGDNVRWHGKNERLGA